MDSLSSAQLRTWSSGMNDDIHFSVAVILESGFYGAYMILFCISIYTLLQGGNRSATTILQIVAFCLMFTLSTSVWAGDIATHILDLQIDRLAFSPTSAQGTLDRYLRQENLVLFLVGCLSQLDFIVGDTLLAWRVYAVFKAQSRAVIWVGGVFVILLFAQWALAIRETVCRTPTIFAPPDSPLCDVVHTAFWAISLLLSLFASLLLWRVVIQRRAAMRRDGLDRSLVDRALYILLVSGVVYAALFLTSCVQLASTNSTLKPIGYVLGCAGSQVVGIYPTIVTIFVLNQQKIFGPAESSPSLEGGTTRASIHFNRNVASYHTHRSQRTTTFSLTEPTRTGETIRSRPVATDSQAVPSSDGMGTVRGPLPGVGVQGEDEVLKNPEAAAASPKDGQPSVIQPATLPATE